VSVCSLCVLCDFYFVDGRFEFFFFFFFFFFSFFLCSLFTLFAQISRQLPVRARKA